MPEGHIRKHKRLFLLLGAMALIGAVFAFSGEARAAAGINDQISFQGKVVNQNGTNVANGNYDFVFRLYTVSSGGTAAWTETWNSGTSQVTVTDGIFQVNLGTHTDLPGSIDFNTDNIYLGIEFNADGEMSPRVHFTAAPYAFNADKVHGLTVTDTTGTLTIPNAETISFGGSFTTSASNDVTLTTSGATNVTLPTTGTLATLAGNEILTNKTIGSTGLTFSGAATDITTASGESLVIVAAGAGVVDIQDATTVDSLTTDTGGVSIASGQSYTGAGAVTLSSATGTALTIDSGTTGAIDIGTSANAKTVTIGNSTTTTTIVLDKGASGNITLSDFTSCTALETNSSGNLVCGTDDTGAGSTAWDTIGDPSGNSAVAMNETVQTLDWNTNNVTAAAFDGLSVTITNDAVTDSNTQRAFAVKNLNDVLTTGTTEALVLLDNADTNEAVGAALNITNSGGGGYTNLLDTPSLDITGAGAITGATGITSATGDITATAGNIVLGSTTRISNTGVGTFITGTVIGSQTFTTNNIADSGALTIASGAASALTLNSGTTGTINIGTDASVETINIGNTGAAVKTIAIGNNSQANTITIGDASATSVSITDNNWSVTAAGAASFASVTSSGAIAANGGITFDAATDTLGAHTLSGTLDANANILTNIGNTGTDFIASTGALTLAGVLTANGGISLSGSQSLSAAALSFIDLGSITHGTTANQGLRLPQAASATPSNPSSGEGYLAWDSAGNQLIVYNGSAWSTVGGSIADDSLDFDKFQDQLDLDISTDIKAPSGQAYVFSLTNEGTGASFRVNDAASDTTPFVIDASGNVGIGVATPASLFEIYGSGADVVSTLTVADTTYDPVTKFRTGSSPAVQFTLGVDNSDSDKFKIYSGDGLGSGDEFVIDASGVTSIANLNLGATSFSDNAGAVSWIDMGVTSSAADNTVESYSAQLDGSNLLTIYALSDGAGAIDTKRVQIGDGGTGVAQPVLFGLDVRNATSNPTDAFEGAMYYNATDDKFRCYQASAWVDCIGSGGTTNLQTAYGNDADGSNTTISLTAADDGLIITNPTSGGNDLSAFTLQVTQQNTTAAISVLDLTQSSNASNAVNLTANSIDTETGLNINANALTTGKGISVAHTTSILANGGSLLNLSSTSADTATTSGTLLNLSSTASTSGTLALITNNTASYTGTTESISMTGATTGTGLGITMGSTLTTGKALSISGASYAHTGTETGSLASLGFTDATTSAVTATTNGLLVSPTISAASGAATRTVNGVSVEPAFTNCAAGTCTVNALNIGSVTDGTGFTGTVLKVTGTGWDSFLDTASIDISGTGAITGATGVSSTTGTFSSALAANGGITFDAATDTLGAFTLAGTLDANTNILTNIGNSGTDFIASTGALTLAGVLTANGGITLAGSQTFTASALSYMDLGAITHGTTAVQGLRLPQAASATPSNPSSGEGYLAWDSAGNQMIYYNGSAWSTIGGGSGYNLIKDETTSLTARTTLAFLGAGVTCADSGSQTECTIAGGSGADLAGTYNTGAAGNQTITLDGTQDSIIVSNPSSAGTDSAFTFKVEQLNTGVANDAVYIDNSGTGNGLRIDDVSGDTTPFIVDGDGRVGIGTSSISAAAATERLLQVGSETNRGNTAVYGEVISKGQRDFTALTNIKDIYVYDTTADSDGGRWIDWATTDKLSWYTETLDDGPSDPCNIATDDRCYKASFPRKAILVVTTDALYIFDAQDNTMWMKFSQNASGYALGVDTNNDPSSVTALNGVIYVATNGTSAGGLYAIDFTSDRMWNYDATDRSGADVGIGSRNSAVTYNSDNNTNFDLGTVGTVADWARINDVSATVIQNSMTIDSTTQGRNNGSTVIGLATDSGLTVINLSTQKVFQYSDATDNDYNSVYVTRGGILYGLNETLGQAEQWRYIDNENIASRVNGTPNKFWDETTAPLLSKAAPTIIAGAPDALEVVERGSLADGGVVSSATVPGSSDLIYVGTNQGLTEIHDHFTSAMGWSKFYNTTRETALMPGTIRRMHTMDDASGDVTNAAKTDVLVPKGTPTYGVNGVRGKAMQFNGTSQYLCSGSAGTCANSANDAINTGSFNFTMWFNHTAGTVTGVDTLFAYCYTTTPAAATGCIAAAMNASGQMVFTLDDDALWSIGAATNNDVTYTTTQTFNDGQWHFLTFSKINGAPAPVAEIDGKVISYATALTHTTLSGSQILGVGTDCSTGAACGTGGNFWDGKIDDFTFSACGTAGCTTDGFSTTAILSYPYMQRLYNDARPTVNRKTITVTDATTATSTTIGDSGEAWIPNEFAGMIVELNGGTGSGQTRRVVGNTATVMTVSPAFTTTPDTTTDFQIQPEKLYGASDSVTSIGITAESPIGEARMLCAGTNSTTDTGGVTCFNHQAGPSLVAEVFHADAKQVDDSGTEWTGTDYDDIQSIDFSGRALVIGSMAHFFTETQDVRLGQGLDYVSSKLNDVRMQVLALGNIPNFAGMIGLGVGLTGGADLAEHYYSNENLSAGEVVSIDKSLDAGVKKTTGAYQRDVLGIVATSPGIVLGTGADNSYPIALAGRVPVKVTNENGQIYTGDRLTTSSRPGYAMRAIQAGRVIGEALGDASDWTVCEDEDPNDVNATLCTTVMVFVNLTDYNGISVDLAMTEKNTTPEAAGLADTTVADGTEQGLASETSDTSIRLAMSMPTKQEQILSFLKDLHEKQVESNQAPSEVFTGRVAASTEVITPTLFADQIFAKSIKADSIEGLEIFTDQLGSLSAKYAALSAQTVSQGVTADTVAAEKVSTLMKHFSAETLVVQLDGNILGKLTVSGALAVGGDAQFDGDTVFSKLASFFGKVTFKDGVVFEKTLTFNTDTAGFAVIAKDQKAVTVTFDTAYDKQPIVTVALTNEENPLMNDAQGDKQLSEDIQAVEKDFTEAVFDSSVQYIVTKKSAKGFTILLNKKAPRDLQFSWVALAVKDGKTFHSEEGKEDKPVVPVEPVPVIETPTVSPTVPVTTDTSVAPAPESSNATETTSPATETPVPMTETTTATETTTP